MSNAPAYDLQDFLALTADDPDLRTGFKNAIITSFESAKANFKIALDKRELQDFRFQAHKLVTSMNLLKATELTTLLQDGRVLLAKAATEELSKEVVDKLELRISRELDLIIGALRAVA